MKAIWKKMGRKKYRDSFVSAHISNTVAAQIAFLRDANGWTQQALADETGMGQSRISALEDPDNENFEIKTLKRIASAFDVGLHVEFVPFSEIIRRSGSVSLARTRPHCFVEDSLEQAANFDWTETGAAEAQIVFGDAPGQETGYRIDQTQIAFH